MRHPLFSKPLFATVISLALSGPGTADQVILDDLIVQGSACVGLDCVDGETFGFDILRLKENNLRIQFEDTSTSANFASNDWRITVNGETNGAASFFAIEDVTADNRPFRVDAGAPNNALRVSADGFIGIGIGRPQVEMHLRTGDTPTLRLEQDGSESFPVQTWDVSGNEANFFIRNVDTDLLPFRIRPKAPQNALVIAGSGQIGIGTGKPKGGIHIRRNQPNKVPHLLLEATRNTGRAELWFADGRTQTDNDALKLQLRGDEFNVTWDGTGAAEFRIAKSGDVSVLRGDILVPNGDVIVGGDALNVPDYVFAPDYELMPLEDVKAFIAEHSHLPHVPAAAAIQANGLGMTEMMLALLKSHEELVLHMLDLDAQLKAQAAEIAALRTAEENPL